MAQYKLTYYDLKGRGEIIRLIFTVADVDFEDVRVSPEEWKNELKTNSPFGQCPTLEFDGHVMCQSISIARFLANRFGLAGKSDLEKARADIVVDCVMDVTVPIVNIIHAQTEERREELKKKFVEEELPVFFGNFEKILKQNNGGDGYFVGDSVTWADLALMDVLDWGSFINHTMDYSAYPKIQGLIGKLYGHSKIAEWRKKW